VLQLQNAIAFSGVGVGDGVGVCVWADMSLQVGVARPHYNAAFVPCRRC